MSVGHLSFDDQSSHGRLLRKFLNGAESMLDDGNDLLAVGTQMIDGDGSQAAHFTYFAGKFGFLDNETAKAAWDELQSIMGKVNTDNSVEFVNAALKQVIAKFR